MRVLFLDSLLGVLCPMVAVPVNCPLKQFSIRCKCKWAWSQGYYWYSKVCFLPWPLHRNWHWQPNDFTIPIVNFPFISNNILASPVYGVYISQLVLYSRACAPVQWFSGQSSAADAKATIALTVMKYPISNDNGSFTFYEGSVYQVV